jgi:hypothetical protein
MSTIKPNKLDHSAIVPALSSPSRRRFLIGSTGLVAAGSDECCNL